MTVAQLPDCPDCARPLAHGDRRGEGVCHECSTRFDVGQCEGCGDRVTDQQATVENVPGATLWWCPDCLATAEQRGEWA
jgi:hypothetical protein